MNREILFRAKRIDTGGWVEGYPSPEGYGMWSIGWIEHGGGNITNEGEWEQWFSHKVDPATIGQFTGKQLNGINLYEGDTLRQWLPDPTTDEPDRGDWWQAEIKFMYGAWRLCQIGFEYREDYHPELLYEELERSEFELTGTIHDK